MAMIVPNNEKILVTKSNELIEASYKLTMNEQRIVLMLAAKVQPDDQEFTRYRITVDEFIDLLELKRTGVYNDIQELLKNLMKKTFGIKREKSILYMPWLASAEYFTGQGYMELEFSPKLKPYLLQLKERFTTYRLHDVMQLRSVYSIRIYELLKQYHTIGSRLFELEDLKFILGIEKNEYGKYGHFKARVLKAAQKELEDKTDIAFDFEEIKVGRKVKKINFIIKRQSMEEVMISPAEKLNDLVARLQEFGLTDIQIDYIVKNYEESYIVENLKIVERDFKKKKVQNLAGYAYKAISDDYRKNKPSAENRLRAEAKYEGVPDYIIEQRKQQHAEKQQKTISDEVYKQKLKNIGETLAKLDEMKKAHA